VMSSQYAVILEFRRSGIPSQCENLALADVASIRRGGYTLRMPAKAEDTHRVLSPAIRIRSIRSHALLDAFAKHHHNMAQPVIHTADRMRDAQTP
jgi:hypothetical protein